MYDDDNLSVEDMMAENEDDQEIQDAQGDSVTSHAKTKGNKRRHSTCWKNFSIVGDRLPDGTHNIKCNHCNQPYNIDLSRIGTNTMLRHSKRCSMTPGCTPGSNKKLDMIVFREMMAIAIVEHNLPYQFVEYRRVRDALSYVNSSIEFWCRNTAVTDVLRIFEKEKANLRKVLSEVPGRISFTTDLWRVITVEGYLCLTAHYLDANGKLHAKIVEFCAFPPPHTGASIAMKLMEILKEWGLEKKVFTVTVDNATANDNMQVFLKRQLRKNLVYHGEFMHIRCVAHILNLIVQDGLSVIGEALEKIRDIVKFVKSSKNREKMFEACVETVGIQNQNKAGLILDVSMRWNSAFKMLSRAIEFKDAFRNLSKVEPSYKCNPSDLEWSRGALIKEFLSPFTEMTKLVSGSKYPTANLYFMQVWKIESWLRHHATSEDDTICEMVKIVRVKFDKYWDDYSDILAIDAVLDPRLKFKCLEYCYTTLNPSTSKAKIDHIRKKMEKLFGVYKKNTKATTTTAS
ncbi:PREDICTED: zinc finger BED domain-containing protein RICESLEEPER 3-like [Brassica oleracea var. oleracea]|uniref:zinc finger BED domain-containing protein RICESLEEPER 3-like n=1 Tax=Brassica oleracea var. oleracea TaxID=109376 RepID=UPI0006A6D32D|nr:PREDICTED: zinc finger BED domain-containing protein RICESLEEPER 3-like [Brassica oleracea var. oleracea]